MTRSVGLGSRVRARLHALGYWKHDRPDVLRFCADKGYRPQYVYAWLKDRAPTRENLARLAGDLQVSAAWLVFGPESAAAPPPAAPAAPAVIELGQLHELTERLVRLEAELHGILRAFPDGYFWLDGEGTILSYKAGAGFEAAPPGQLVGRPIHAVLGDDPTRMQEGLRRALASGAVVPVEYAPPGAEPACAFEVRFVPLPGSADQRRLLAIVRDITERARAEETTRTLMHVSHELAATLDLSRAADRVVSAVVQLFGVPGSMLFRVDPSEPGLVCVAAAGGSHWNDWIGRRLPLGGSIAGLAVVENRPVWSPDVTADPRLTLPDWVHRSLEATGNAAVCGLPLRGPDGTVGAITLVDALGRAFSEEELRLVAAFADEATLAIRNAELFAAAERRRRAAESLAAVGRSLSRSLDPNEVGQRIAESVRGLLQVASSALYRVVPQTGELGLFAYAGGETAPLDTWNALLPPGYGVAGLTIRERRAVAMADVLTDPRVRLTAEMRERVAQGPLRSALAVPLVVQDRVIGVLSLADLPGRRFSEEERGLMEAFADHAVIALENARLYAEAERRRQVAESLAELGRLLAQSTEPRTVAQRIAESIQELLGVLAATVYVVEGDRRTALAASGSLAERILAQGPMPLATGLSGLAMESRRAVSTPDGLADSRLVWPEDSRALLEGSGHRAGLAVPLVVRGRVIGALALDDRAGRAFHEEEVRLAQTFGDQAAIVLENARLTAADRRRREAAESVATLARALSQSLDPEEVAWRTVDSARSLLRAPVATLYRLEPKSGNLVVLADRGDGTSGEAAHAVVPGGTGVSGWAIRENRAVATEDVLADPRLVHSPASRAGVERSGIRSGVAVPVAGREHVLGVLVVGDRAGRRFEPDEVQALQTFADQAALALENARLYADARRRREAAEALADVSRLLTQSLDAPELARRVVDRVAAALAVPAVVLYRLDPEAGALVSLAQTGSAAADGTPVVVPAGTGISGIAVAERRAVTSADALADPRVSLDPGIRARAARAGLASGAAVPLVVRDRVMGALTVGDAAGRHFTDEELETLQAIADQAALVLQHQAPGPGAAPDRYVLTEPAVRPAT